MPVWVKKSAPFVLTGVLAVGISCGVLLLVQHRNSNDVSEARIPPVEFLYLDGPRILKYLSELEGGEVGEVRRISNDIESVNVGGSASGFSVGASSQHETSAESTLVRNEASALDLLLRALHANDRHGIDMEAVSLNKPADLRDVREGTLVRFVTHYLLSPGYIRPYVVVRQSATLAALFPRTPGVRIEAKRKDAVAFAHQVGPDPRLTFAVAPPPQNGKKGLKLLLPMSYHGLTEERSLLEKGRDEYTGGRLVVIGKVIRVFHESSEGRCHTEYPCVPEYTEYGTRETWHSALGHASKFLIERVSHNCEMPRSKAEKRRFRAAHPLDRRSPVPVYEGRSCLLHKLDRQTELFGPGAVIVPIAIYK